MRVLITRPLQDAVETAALLEARGHSVIIAPLLVPHFHDGPSIALDGVQAILVTSANGVRALGRRSRRRNVPLFAVGPQTEAEALRFGFEVVRNAQGDSRALAAATAQWASPEGGALLHVKAAEADGTLGTLLKAQGFDVRNDVLYEVAPATALPPDTRAALTAREIDAALFYSARSAGVFRDLAAGLDVGGIVAICISAATAQGLSPLSFREIRVAPEPNQAALLECLG